MLFSRRNILAEEKEDSGVGVVFKLILRIPKQRFKQCVDRLRTVMSRVIDLIEKIKRLAEG